jgi:hypothetical protein
MTVVQLVVWIATALLLQVTTGLGVVLRRRRGTSAALPAIPDHVGSAPVSAWTGWRELRVQARVYEDAAQSQCSFCLEPVDGAPLPTFKPGRCLTFSLDMPDETSDTADAPSAVTRCHSLSNRRYPGATAPPSNACRRRRTGPSLAGDASQR